MKIPDKIRINGVDYEITLVKANEIISNDGHICYGMIDHDYSQIKLSNDKQGHQEMCCTLWHELVHAFLRSCDIDLGDKTEAACEAVSRGIYQVLQDNARELFDIVQADK